MTQCKRRGSINLAATLTYIPKSGRAFDIDQEPLADFWSEILRTFGSQVKFFMPVRGVVVPYEIANVRLDGTRTDYRWFNLVT